MNPKKKKKFLPYKNLGELYVETAYNEPVIKRINEILLKEGNIDLYIREPEAETPDKVGTVKRDFYNKKIKPQIKLGNIDTHNVRDYIEKRLEDAKGLINDNLDVYQTFISESDVKFNSENTHKFRTNLLKAIEDNKRTTLAELIAEAYESSVEKVAENLPSVISTFPISPRFGRAGEGELAFGFFAGGKKPEKGDVKIEGTLIETKGPAARLYKTDPIGKISVFDLEDAITSSDEQQIEKISNVIIKYAGNTATLNDIIRPQIVKAVTTHYPRIKNEFLSTIAKYSNKSQYITVNNNDLFIQIMGVSQLLAYRQDTGFDGIIIFNKTSSKIPICCLNMKDATIDSLLSIKDVKIKFNGDSNGYTINYQ